MLSQVVEGESQVHFRMHQFLARENGKPEALFYIQEGWACRYRLLSDGRRQITALYLPGDYCDPQWVLGGVSSQPVVAITNVRALRLPCRIPSRADFDGQHAFWKALAGMIERQTNWLVSLGRMTALERIAHLLLELFDRMRQAGLAYGQQCAMPLTQIDRRHDRTDAGSCQPDAAIPPGQGVDRIAIEMAADSRTFRPARCLRDDRLDVDPKIRVFDNIGTWIRAERHQT